MGSGSAGPSQQQREESGGADGIWLGERGWAAGKGDVARIVVVFAKRASLRFFVVRGVSNHSKKLQHFDKQPLVFRI